MMGRNKGLKSLAGRIAAEVLSAVLVVTGSFSVMPQSVYADEVLTVSEDTAQTEDSSENTEDATVQTDATDESSEENVSENETDQVSENDTASDNEAVSDNSTVSENDTVSENETVSDNSSVSENETTSGNTCETDSVETDSTNTGTITLTDSSVSLSDGLSGVSVNTADGYTEITISENGTYTFTGTSSNAVIATESTLDELTLILSDLTIDNASLASSCSVDKPVIDLAKDTSVTLTLTGSNTLKGSNSFSDEPEPLIKQKKDSASSSLTINGSGSLTLTDQMSSSTEFGDEDPSDGISSASGTVNLNSGTIYITVNGDAIKAKGGEINAAGAEINVTDNGGDAIKAKNGTVNISAGTVNLTGCKDDGIQAEEVNISGGTVNIETEYENASTVYYDSTTTSSTKNTLVENSETVKTEIIRIDTGSHSGIKAGTKAKTYYYGYDVDNDNSSTLTDPASESASGGINITGGSVTINTSASGLKANNVTSSGYTKTNSGVYIIGSPDDAVKSNNYINISGGTLNITSGDDGISAAGDVAITGSAVVNVNEAYEGIEGKTVTIGTENASGGPTVTINSNDDGINCASKSVVYYYESESNEDTKYKKVSTSTTTGNNGYIYSGTVTVKIDTENTKSKTLASSTVNYKATGDGIDCNGSLYLYGGTTYVFGESSGSNSPLDTSDSNGVYLGSAATVLAAGCDGMGDSTPGSGDGTYLTYGSSGTGGGFGQMPGGSSSASIAANSTFKVVNGSTTLINTTLPYAASFVLYASPGLVSGTSYTLTVGSTQTTATAVGLSGSGSGEESGSGSGSGSGEESGSGSGSSESGSSSDTSADIVDSGTDSKVSEVSTGTYSSTAEMVKGQTYTFGTGSWTTSDKTVVAVAKKTGKATAKKAGTATLTNTYTDGSTTITKTIAITVYVPVLSATKLTLVTGESSEVSLTNTGSLAQSWSSSKTAVAKVSYSSGTGKATITAVGTGSCVIYAYAGGKANKIKVTVKDVIYNGTLTESSSTLKLNAFQYYTLKKSSYFVPNKATWTDESGNTLSMNAKKAYFTSDGVLTITKGGKIYAAAVGNTVIKGTDKNGSTVTITVNVTAVPKKTDVYVNVGKYTTLKHTYVKKGASWSAGSSAISLTNADKPTVKIYGSSVGSTTLTCTYNGATYTTTVHVEDPSLTTDSLLLRPKSTAQTYTLTLTKGSSYTITQSNVSQSVTWKSSKPAVGFVNDSGVIRARSKGSAGIYTKINGTTVKIKLKVTE